MLGIATVMVTGCIIMIAGLDTYHHTNYSTLFVCAECAPFQEW